MIGGMGMGGGGGGGGGGGMGPGWLRDLPDVKATYNKEVTRRAFGYVKPHLRQVVLSLTLTVLAAIFVTLSPVLTKIAIDSYIAKGNVPGMLLFMGLTVLVLLLAFAANWAQLFIMTRVGQRMLQKMRMDLFRRLQDLPLTFFDRVPNGVVVSRVINDVQTINDLLTNGILSAFSDLLTLLFTVAVMLLLDARLAAVAFAVLPLMALAVWIFAKKAQIAFRDTRTTIGVMTGELAESISGVRVVQAFAREGASQAKFDEINDSNRAANIRANTLASGLLPVIEVCNAVATVAVIAFGGYLIVNQQSTLGTLVAFLAYVTRFFQPIRTLTQFYNQVQAATAGAEKVFEVMDEPVTVTDSPHALSLPTVRGEVEFRDVSFSYGREPVLSSVSFHADPGEMVAMVGHTGAGKTTVASLLARFYDPISGQVLLDGHDLRDLTDETLRRTIALVLQDNLLFSGTIADNIRYSRPTATDQQVIDAARVANAHDFIERLPQGYETPVLERAANLSLGQRQLIAIGRAVLSDPRVLILDEATSNIDSQTEMLVQRALHDLLSGRTSLVIAHRLSTIRAADQVLVLDRGEIIERGRHEELLKTRGFYYNLYQQQFLQALNVA